MTMAEAEVLDGRPSAAADIEPARAPIGKDRLAAAAGACVWLLVAVARLGLVPESWWRQRDDAVITLSHARGLVDFGVVSVSATPERVEGYSTPLQFLLALPYYALGGRGWEVFLDVQVLACVLGMGYFAARLIALVVPTDRRTVVVGASLAAVLVFWPFVTAGWLMSGMESSLSGLLLIGSAYAVVGAHRGAVRPIIAGCSIALLGIARVEFFVLVLPLLLLAVVSAHRRGGWKAVLPVAVPAMILWLAVHTTRWVYFGSLIPNSGTVQGKGSAALVASWALVAAASIGMFCVGRLYVRRQLRGPGPRPTPVRAAPALCGALGAALSLLLLERFGPEDLRASIDVLEQGLIGSRSGLWLPAALCAICWIVGARLPRFPTAVLGLCAAVPLAQTALFGAARLDALRILGLAQIPLSILAVSLLLEVVTSGQAASWVRERRTRTTLALLLVSGMACLALLALGPARTPVAAQPLCCDITAPAERLRGLAADRATATGISTPIVASPDLGKVSFEKTTATVDLGYLGSPFLTLVAKDRPDLVDDLLLDVLAPDVIELHGGWLCVYQGLLASPTFDARYEIAYQEPGEIPGAAHCPEAGRLTAYSRVLDESYRAESHLSSGLLVADDPERLVRDALRACAEGGSDPFRCEWVRRAAQRGVQQLPEADRDAVISAFRDSPSAALDEVLLTSGEQPAWQDAAFAAFVGLAGPAVVDGNPTISR
jgi:hypothetical protein